MVYAQEGRALEFVLYEPARWFHCLDFERSKVPTGASVRQDAPGAEHDAALQYFDVPPYRVKWVDDLVLKDLSQVDEDIFRVEHLPTRLFCTARCVELVKKRKLTGFKFEQVTTTE